MPQRQPLKGCSQLRVSSADWRPLTDRSPKFLGDRRSPRGSQSDPLTQRKLGSRISDLENQLGLAQEELKRLKEQLASTETTKKMEKKTKRPVAVLKREEEVSNEKENSPASQVLDDSYSQQETDVFEVPVERVAMENDEINSLKAKLEEKEKELANFSQENESLKQRLKEKAVEALSAKTKEEAAALQLNQVRKELETSRDNAAMFNEKLEASEKAKEALETEMRKLHIQTEQWRKAADAAAAFLSGDMEMKERRMSERYCNSVFEPVVGGYGGYMGYSGLFDDSEVISESGKKKGSGIKMFGDLWKRKSQK